MVPAIRLGLAHTLSNKVNVMATFLDGQSLGLLKTPLNTARCRLLY